MGNRAFAIASGTAVAIANDVDDFRYRAVSISVPAGVQTEPRTNDGFETHFLVEDGFVEVMIGGATAMVLAGDFVRVPPGIVFAYRNSGDEPARLLMRRVNPGPARRALRIICDHAA